MQVDLLDRPGVLDGVAEAVVEVRVAHRPQGQVHPRVEQHRRPVGRGRYGGGHWQASQVSGFSREQATASATRTCWAIGGLLDPGRRARAQVVRRLQPGLPGVAGTSSESLPIVGAARNRFSDWLWSMYGARAAARSISARCGSSHAVRNSSRTSAGRSTMPCTEPVGPLDRVADLLGPQAAGLQLAHQRRVDLEELPRQRLALEQVGHLRLDALVAAGDRGDGGGRRDRDQQRVAQPVRGDPLPQRRPALASGCRSRPRGRAAAARARRGSPRTPGAAPCRSARSADVSSAVR